MDPGTKLLNPGLLHCRQILLPSVILIVILIIINKLVKDIKNTIEI